jgi:acyl carrier protein
MATSLDTLYDLIVEEFSCDRSELTPETTLESLGIDSLAKMEMLFDLEDRLGLHFPEDNREISTIQDVATFMDEVKQAQKDK